MTLSPDKKLRQLSDKKTELENKIKEIKKAENRELKKLHDKRCQILGKYIYDSLKKGKPVNLDSLENITEFLDPLVKRKSDRELFGLSVSNSTESDDSKKDTEAEQKLEDKSVNSGDGNQEKKGSKSPTKSQASSRRKTTKKSTPKKTDTEVQSSTPTSQKTTEKTAPSQTRYKKLIEMPTISHEEEQKNLEKYFNI